jgi:mediator of replication checkpoint protein 1
MLAAFDSDSDSDNGISTTVQRHSIVKSKLSPRPTSGGDLQGSAGNNEEEDEDENIIVPRGRMAARMQVEKNGEHQQVSSADESETAYERVARRLHAQLQQTQPPQKRQDPSTQLSEDENPGTGFGRRLLKKRKPVEADDKSDRSPSRERSASPLFVSSPSRSHEEPNEQQDQPEAGLKANSRFLALVAQKRKEREERERLEAEKKTARAQQMKQFSDEILSGEDSDDEAGTGRKLTQQSRPTRKASKKALEEMHRETQRMSRNMQLAHQARTKKKITKESFLARFNFMQPQGPPKPETAAANSSTTASSPPSSDAEGQNQKTTPPTSPIRDTGAENEKSHPVAQEQTEEICDLPSMEELFTQPPAQQGSVAVGRVEVSEPTPAPEPTTSKPKSERKVLTKPPVRVRISRQLIAQHQKEDSDSDLEVITSPGKCRRVAAFENLPARHAQESSSMLKLKALAHLTSPTRRSTSMTTAELSATLRFQARQQALKEREERLQELKARGIVIETAAERAAMEDEVEDLMEKARKEAEEIARREKATRQKDRGTDGDSEEDEDYELSGSDGDDDDDAANNDDNEEESEEDGLEGNEEEENDDLVEQEAVEADESEDERIETMSVDAEPEMPAPAGTRKRRTRVISDDEDEEQEIETPAKSVAESATPQRPQFPDMPASNGVSMGLTQAFAGTLGDSQPDNEEDSLKIFRTLPDPDLPVAEMLEADSQVIVKDSQEQRGESVDLLAGYTQSDARISESPAPHGWSQVSQIPDPTQDAGFVLSPFDQTKRFLPPPSTIETVLLPENESPVQKKRSRLLQRGRPAQLSDSENDDFEIKASAFDVMRKAAKKSGVSFDKSKSKAKEHVDEAAEESEDEYAGLGGASDDSAVEEEEEEEYDRQMINDNSEEVVDAKELAALNA